MDNGRGSSRGHGAPYGKTERDVPVPKVEELYPSKGRDGSPGDSSAHERVTVVISGGAPSQQRYNKELQTWLDWMLNADLDAVIKENRRLNRSLGSPHYWLAFLVSLIGSLVICFLGAEFTRMGLKWAFGPDVLTMNAFMMALHFVISIGWGFFAGVFCVNLQMKWWGYDRP